MFPQVSSVPVFVYATDPLSASGARAQLAREPRIELVLPTDIDRARVAVVVADRIDDTICRVIRATQRGGVPHVVLVATRFDEAGVVAAAAAGVTGFLRRGDATAERLVQAIEEADRVGCSLPAGLLRRAATVGGPAESPFDPAPVAGPAPVELSPREMQVLRLVAEGFDTAEVAEQLAYSESTIKGVLAKVMNRLEVRNRSHAVAVALRQGLI